MLKTQTLYGEIYDTQVVDDSSLYVPFKVLEVGINHTPVLMTLQSEIISPTLDSLHSDLYVLALRKIDMQHHRDGGQSHISSRLRAVS